MKKNNIFIIAGLIVNFIFAIVSHSIFCEGIEIKEADGLYYTGANNGRTYLDAINYANHPEKSMYSLEETQSLIDYLHENPSQEINANISYMAFAGRFSEEDLLLLIKNGYCTAFIPDLIELGYITQDNIYQGLRDFNEDSLMKAISGKQSEESDEYKNNNIKTVIPMVGHIYDDIEDSYPYIKYMAGQATPDFYIDTNVESEDKSISNIILSYTDAHASDFFINFYDKDYIDLKYAYRFSNWRCYNNTNVNLGIQVTEDKIVFNQNSVLPEEITVWIKMAKPDTYYNLFDENGQHVFSTSSNADGYIGLTTKYLKTYNITTGRDTDVTITNTSETPTDAVTPYNSNATIYFYIGIALLIISVILLAIKIIYIIRE